MRWAQKLQSPQVVADGCEFDASKLTQGDCSLTLGPDGEGRLARVGISFADGRVSVTVLAEGPASDVRPDHEEWYNRAHLAVLGNPHHDHATRWTFAVDDRNEVVCEAHFACPGEELNDDAARELESKPGVEGEFQYLDDRRFFARLCFNARDFWPEAGPAGLALRVGFHEIPIPGSLAWPERVSWTKDSPLIFGDVYRKSSGFYVDHLDFGTPIWGGEPSPVSMHCRLENGPKTGQVKVKIDLPGDGVYEQDAVDWACSGNAGQIEIPLVFPFRAKWANGLMNVARLHLVVVDESGDEIWSGSFPFGFDTGILVRERFGGQRALRPDAKQADFLDAFRAYVLTGLPDYVMQTTRDGAPSDFYLLDRDGGDDLDLSAEDALDRAAMMIAGRFSNWQDALCAAAMWVHHPCVTRHSSTWSRVSNGASIETIPRLAGCFCGDTTRLTALLAEKIGGLMNVPVKGWSMGLRGHLATLVDTPVGQVVVDGMLGLWFHTLDNTRLATLDEMRACREIAERAWYAPRAHGHEFFYGTDNQLIRAYQSGPLEWPGDGR